MSKYKIGDEVTIRTDLKKMYQQNDEIAKIWPGVAQEMTAHSGETYIITSIQFSSFVGRETYELSGQASPYVWIEDWLEDNKIDIDLTVFKELLLREE